MKNNETNKTDEGKTYSQFDFQPETEGDNESDIIAKEDLTTEVSVVY